MQRRWRHAWESAECHRAPRHPSSKGYFIHDAAPFPNGPLHMGHVRTYVLGDIHARSRRLLGHEVLYYTGFDAFGLPIELAAAEIGVQPIELVRESIATMTEQLKALGISYDWSMVQTTCDPRCYRWTQWLFLEMFDAGLVERREAELSWCDRCETTLARLQINDECCWRCGEQVGTRRLDQWFVRTSALRDSLLAGLSRLEGWSHQVKAMLRGLLLDREGGEAGDWLVSRQRSWGTPIPLVDCGTCGVVPVPRDALPVVLPDDLDWGGGPGPLARHETFRSTACPRCGAACTRETDTLDCFFDDIWCFLQGLVLGVEDPGFTRENLMRWLPVDLCQSGFDTVAYFHLYRFLGRFLAERGLIDDPEMIRRFPGSAMVLAGGRKMSKHLGNAVSPAEILDEFGADALRVAIVWAAEPSRDLSWSRSLLIKARRLLEQIHELYDWIPDRSHPQSGPSRAARQLESLGEGHHSRAAAFIDAYRPHAAVAEIASWCRGLRRFAERRVPTGRIGAADAGLLCEQLDRFARTLAPFAPYLAQECWHRLGHDGLLGAAGWPRQTEA